MSRAVKGRRRRIFREGTPQQRLLLAASDVFTARGYSAASVREIVERAGVTKPVLYYHFGSKEGVYRAIIGQLLSEFDKRLSADHEGSDSRQRVARICSDMLEFVEERIESVRFFYSVYFGAPQGAPYFDFDVFILRLRQAIVDAVSGGVATGELRNIAVADFARAVEAVLNLAVESVLFEPERCLRKDDLTRLLNFLFVGAAQPAVHTRNKSRKEIRR